MELSFSSPFAIVPCFTLLKAIFCSRGKHCFASLHEAKYWKSLLTGKKIPLRRTSWSFTPSCCAFKKWFAWKPSIGWCWHGKKAFFDARNLVNFKFLRMRFALLNTTLKLPYKHGKNSHLVLRNWEKIMLNNDLMKMNRCNFMLQCDLFLMMGKRFWKDWDKFWTRIFIISNFVGIAEIIRNLLRLVNVYACIEDERTIFFKFRSTVFHSLMKNVLETWSQIESFSQHVFNFVWNIAARFFLSLASDLVYHFTILLT